MLGQSVTLNLTLIWCKVGVESCVIRVTGYLELVNCSNKYDGFKCVKCYGLVRGVTLQLKAGVLRILYLLLTFPNC